MKNKREHIRRAIVLLQAVASLMILATTFVTSSGLASAPAAAPSWSETASLNTATLRANGKIAFSSDRDGNREIYVMNADGTNHVRLTNNLVVDDHPTWSPDGTKIAFVSERSAGGFAIFVMNADGTNKVEIIPIVFNATAYPIWDAWGMSWSPDGNRIVFQEKVEPSPYPAYPNDIFIVNIDDRTRQILVDDPVDARQPSWSPDGSKILFVSQRFTGPFFHKLYTVRPDGSDLKQLAGLQRETDLAPTWSPTGEKIAFQIFDYANFESIGIANADGSGRYWFDDGSDGADYGGRDKPQWSPDGSKIIFHVSRGNIDTEIYVKNINGTGLTQLTNTPGSNFKPSWQPLAPADCSNSIDCADLFVRQQYLDFLNREPDPGGLAYWTNEITKCGSDARCIHDRRIAVSGAFFVEPEFQETGYFVDRLYQASFGHHPSFAQFNADRALLTVGPNLEASKQALAANWVERTAFKDAYSMTMSPEEFVNKLFDTANLKPYTTERQQLATDMRNGKSRAQLLREVIEVPEFKTRQYNPAFVLMQYFGYLRRNVDQGGYDFWLDVLNNREPNNYPGMICSFITSREYQERFGSVVTRSNADCGQ